MNFNMQVSDDFKEHFYLNAAIRMANTNDIYIYMTGVLSRYKLKRMLAPGEQQYKLVSFIYQDASNI